MVFWKLVAALFSFNYFPPVSGIEDLFVLGAKRAPENRFSREVQMCDKMVYVMDQVSADDVTYPPIQ